MAKRKRNSKHESRTSTKSPAATAASKQNTTADTADYDLLPGTVDTNARVDDVVSRKKEKQTRRKASNPLLDQQLDFLSKLSDLEKDSFFSSELDPDRRAELWMMQADLGENLVNSFAWATPDDRALRILRHFSPIIEIGCGAQAYWCSLMHQSGIDVIGFDLDPSTGGTISKSSVSQRQFQVFQGGAEVLLRPEHAARTLFLCYPDENETDADSDSDSKDSAPSSLALSCLENYRGDYVIHVGELFNDTTFAMDQAPWGRSSSPEFQQQLAAQYHCLLRVGLPSWLHVSDTLSVWKRSEACPIVFGGEEDDDQDECLYYRYVVNKGSLRFFCPPLNHFRQSHVPVHERLPKDIAAPCLAHLLLPEKREFVNDGGKGRKERNRRHPSHRTSDPPPLRKSTDIVKYDTPW